ncbi:unnamed protein product (macronuclear) [Paramecium tetraurelia]|uniref:60S ribosomal protein L7a n=1 Tax=Paramecium tetraurelia TaxID=5888 RepID=A0EHU7_PARTE|nr:uncharacterized protein GSPATT00027215001 [Paramecium tetraurelia]CAK94888.1 unnamed protein product [Paramecium tetraurelia]|eukprot:XP_001462261.1 hypothetical protein (macronuclear) [Paramecium tetraurelia strain d4-2]
MSLHWSNYQKSKTSDPIELVVWLPQLCRRQEVPFCFIKNKARLGALVHQKTATCVALTDVRKEDQAEFDNLARDLRQHYNENHELLRTIGGGQVGIKSKHQYGGYQESF